MVIHPGYSHQFHKVQIRGCYLTETAPEIVVEGEPMADCFGQWIQKEWDTKIHSEEELVSFLKAEYNRAKEDNSYPEGWSRFGGTKKVVLSLIHIFFVSLKGKSGNLLHLDLFSAVRNELPVTRYHSPF